MMMRYVAAALLALMTPAAAADMPMGAPASAAPVSWTGFYLGGWIGGRSANIESTACSGGPIGLNCPTDFPLNGLIAGISGGYDYQFGNGFVLGALVSVPLVRPTTTTTTPLFAPFGLSWEVKPRYSVAAAGRAGFAVGNLMPYALAGVALARVEVTSSFGTSSVATHIGPVLGAGIEARLSKHISVDARYALGLLGSAQYDFCGMPGCQSSYKERSHNFLVGANYRF